MVDDEENISFLVSSALRVEGFDVATASSGRTGLSEAERRQPDVIVLDVMLGDMDGFEVLRRLRDGGSGSDIPVIVATSKDLSRRETDWLGAHAREVVRKGADGRAELLAALRRLAAAAPQERKEQAS